LRPFAAKFRDSEGDGPNKGPSWLVFQKLILNGVAKFEWADGDQMETAKKIRVVVADDSTIYRNNVCLMIRLQKDMEVVAEAENGWLAEAV
jgi:hypothetical protein